MWNGRPLAGVPFHMNLFTLFHMRALTLRAERKSCVNDVVCAHVGRALLPQELQAVVCSMVCVSVCVCLLSDSAQIVYSCPGYLYDLCKRSRCAARHGQRRREMGWGIYTKYARTFPGEIWCMSQIQNTRFSDSVEHIASGRAAYSHSPALLSTKCLITAYVLITQPCASMPTQPGSTICRKTENYSRTPQHRSRPLRSAHTKCIKIILLYSHMVCSYNIIRLR